MFYNFQRFSFAAQPLPEFTSIVIRQSPPPQQHPQPDQAASRQQQAQDIREVALESLPEMVTELFDPLPAQQQLTPVPPATVVAPSVPSTRQQQQPIPAALSSLIPVPPPQTTTTMTVINIGGGSITTSTLPRMTTVPTVTTVLSPTVVSPSVTVYPAPTPTTIAHPLFFEKKAVVVKTETVASPAGLVDTSTPLSEDSVSSSSLIPDMITDLQDLTDLLNDESDSAKPSLMENLYADISQAKTAAASSTPYNTRNSCWESGSSSSATSSGGGSHFEFSDLSLSDFGMSEAISSVDWPDIKSITT